MTNRRSAPRLDPITLLALARSFSKKEDGTITIFACFMIFMMMMIGGIGVDMMSHEMERTRIQGCADRAVLAAADLDQELDPTAVVHDYFDKCGMAEFVSNVDVDQGINYRTVRVDASTDVNTMFMDYLGRQTLHVPAVSAAEEKINKVEISMVLDISGSMRHNGKMQNLREAAGTFLDAVLTPANRDLISVSVAPYTAQTNAGEEIFDMLNVNQLHNWSHCIDFNDSDFDSTAIYFGNSAYRGAYDQMQHFDAGYSWPGWYPSNWTDQISNPGCPKQDFETVFAFSQNKDLLKDRINQFEPRANTAIHLGMKWGVAMLDPEWRSFNAALSSVDPAFRTRPADFPAPGEAHEAETLKTIILMTDGENVHTQRIADRVYARQSHYNHWSNYPLNAYLNRYVRSSDHWRWKYTKYTPDQADALLDRICDAAKEKNIVIWAIAFEAPQRGEDVMRECASSQSHYFAVEGVEISEAFQSIARQINQLRLTQ